MTSVAAQKLSTYGLGASEIAAVAGLSPYASPWDIWLRKTGQAPDVETSDEMDWGNRLEPAIRQKYVDVTRTTIHVPGESLFHPGRPWARATPDGIGLEDDQRVSLWTHIVQCKNVGYWVGKDWEQAPPAYVQLQESWEMYVTGLARADVAALIGGNDFRIYTVHRDDKLVADLVDIAESFWRRVESRTPPPIDASPACRDHFVSRLAGAPAVELVADLELEQTMGSWHAAKGQLKQAEREVDRCRNVVLSALSSAGADRLVSSYGIAKLARHEPRTVTTTNWRLVAELTASAPDPSAVYSDLVAANTNTTMTEATVSLREPRGWSKESK